MATTDKNRIYPDTIEKITTTTETKKPPAINYGGLLIVGETIYLLGGKYVERVCLGR
jgi:hypothetical protein